MDEKRLQEIEARIAASVSGPTENEPNEYWTILEFEGDDITVEPADVRDLIAEVRRLQRQQFSVTWVEEGGSIRLLLPTGESPEPTEKREG